MKNRYEPLAIVGLGGVFPSAADLESFWKILNDATYVATEPGTDRWPLDAKKFHCKTLGTADTILSTNVCTLKEIPENYEGLDIDKDELHKLDPLCRLVLSAGNSAFKSAKMDDVDRSRVGVAIANIVLPTDATSKITSRVLKEAATGFDLSSEGCPKTS